MRKLILALLMFIALATLLFLPAAQHTAAQTGNANWPPLNGVVADNTNNLDAARVNSAAKPLQNVGVKVLVVFMDNIRPYGDFDTFSDDTLIHYGFARQNVDGSINGIDPALYALFVTLNPRTISVRYGDNWIPALESAGTGGQATQADSIRATLMIPRLSAGDYTGAMVNGLQGGASAINNYQNPPTAAPLPTTPPAVINNTEIDTGGIGLALLAIIVLIVLVGLAIWLVPWLLRTLGENRKRADERKKLLVDIDAARGEAADLLTDISLPSDPNEQIDYRFLELATEQERPQQLAAITDEYHKQSTLFAATLQDFTTLNGNPPTATTDVPELERMASEYRRIAAQAGQVRDFLARISAEASQVQQQSVAAPGEAERAKKALATAVEQYKVLPAVAPLQFPGAEQFLTPASEYVRSAESNLADNRPLAAYDAAMQVQPTIARLLARATAVDSAYGAYSERDSAIAEFERHGYNVEPGRNLLARAAQKLRDAVSALTAEDDAAAGAAATEANNLATQALELTQSRAALRAENDRRAPEIEKAGDTLAALIAEGRRTFDQVDDYAESSWTDIRGNGSEAQAAADRAHSLWEDALALNRMSGAAGVPIRAEVATPTRAITRADGESETQQFATANPDEDAPAQDFEGAKERLDEAEREIERARSLIAAITDRLANLRESQRITKDEIAAASQSIAEGHNFIAQHDPDISPRPDDVLDEAQQNLERAQAEVAKAKPDWIAALAAARKADDLADRALADARSQEEKIAALRQALATAQQQSLAAVSKAANFANVHRSDIGRNSIGMLNGAQQSMAGADTQAQQTRSLEDERLASALTAAVTFYKAAEQNANNAYDQLYREFSVMESIRLAVDNAIRQAGEAIRDADSYFAMHGSSIGSTPRSRLQQARALLPSLSYRRDLSKEDLEIIQQRANRAAQEARTALGMGRRNVADVAEAEAAERAAQQAAWTASIFSGSSGSSSSSGSSGGGFSWGSGGSSSSSWGGGGHSSSSFGGGGGSKSSFGGGGSSTSGW